MATMQQVKKRNGGIVEFDPKKITIVVEKAFSAVRGGIEAERLERITQTVVSELERFFVGKVPSVENVQDVVERTIMQEGFFDVAKAYIIYRYEHTKVREERKQEVLKKIEEHELTVIKRSLEREIFSIDKIKRTLSYAISGFEDVIDVNKIAEQCQLEVYDGITTTDIERSLAMVARSMIELDPAYGRVAARLLMKTIYHEAIGRNFDYADLAREHRAAFIHNIKKGVELERFDPRLLEFNLEEVAGALDTRRDDLFSYLGLQTIYDRYFVRDHEAKRVLETPQMFWMRIAMGTALEEKDRIGWAKKFYDIMSAFLYTPSTPTLFHAGTPRPQMSSCYLGTTGDSLGSIFKSYADCAQLSKWSGGIGWDWTNIRGTGAFIKGTGVESNGVIPFLKIANDVTMAINRSGRRRGASCVYLETWHYDIEDFLELRKNTGDERRRAHDMDTANWIPDLFMKRVAADEGWTLFSPDETPDLHHIYGKKFEEHYTQYEHLAEEGKIKTWKRVKARDLWKKMLGMLFETGHPWITFKDPANIRSPQDHAGVVHSSNLCTEITLNTSEEETAVCNLGSLNFAKFVTDGKFDPGLVGDVVRVAMRMLDNVIDINFYPTQNAERSNLRHRPVGLGIRGFQDALYMLGIRFDSDDCVKFSDESMEVVSYYAILASSELARERGTYQTYAGSKWDRGIFPQDTLDLLERERGETIPVSRGGLLDWTPVREHVREFGMRNSNCLAIAPTATTANIVGCIPTVEPIYKNIYVKSNQAGDFVIVNEYLVGELKKLAMWNKEMLAKIKFYDGNIEPIMGIPRDLKDRYKETFQIDPTWLIKSAAYRGKWIDQSQSLNIYFAGSSGKQLSDIYQYAWQMGLKTTYYLRTLAASQVEKSTVDAAEFGATHIRKQVVAEAEALIASTGEPTIVTETVSTSITVGDIENELVPVQRLASIAPEPALLCKIDDPDCEACQS